MKIITKAIDTVSFKPRIIELNSESNDIYMELTLCILTNQVNLNNLHFTDDYIHGIVNNKNRFIGIPLVVNRTKLEYGLYNNLGHELDTKNKVLKTDTIGSFVDFWEETDDDGSLLLMGSARIFKRYPNVCEAVSELYSSDELEFSCEAMVYGYSSIDDDTGIRSVDYEFDGTVNSLFGSCIVTNPAEVKSKATLLVAEALNKDTQGGVILPEAQETQEFNKGIKINYNGKLETASLKFTDISDQVYNLLNPINPRTSYREYNYYVYDMYTDCVIVEDASDWKTYWKIGYSIENDVVMLEPQESWIEGYRGFIPKGVKIEDLIVAKETAQVEVASITNQHKEEKERMEEDVQKLNEKINELNAKVDELNQMIVTKQEEVTTLQDKNTELNSQVETLTPFKEQIETAAKKEKQDNLTTKYSKLLSEETMKSEETIKAIEELNEVKLNEIVVSEISKVGTGAEQNNNVIVTASQNDDLIPQSRKSKLYEVRK